MKNPIWNGQEARLRSFFRVLIQFLLFYVVLVPFLFGASKLASLKFQATPAILRVLSSETFQFGLMFLTIFGSVWLCTKLLDKRPLSDVGLVKNKTMWLDYFTGYFLAFSLVALMLIIELVCGVVHITRLNWLLLMNPQFSFGIVDAFLACTLIGFHEELLRFYQIRNISEGLAGIKGIGKDKAIIIATLVGSIIFGCLHLVNSNVNTQSVVMLFLSGLFLSLSYITTGSGLFAFGFHSAWDFAEGSIFGFPVSGTAEQTRIFEIQQSGNAVFTGGDFGPDGGLINLVMVVFGVLGTIMWLRGQKRKLELNEDLCNWKPPA
ncbi:MAG: CPBP family intramembrane metalloprotease [Candidatus Obscuribacterales bacterium]|nr:CPBP family intramembrane metalloprotease [Candidatus Obscuribacterales bacterium]